MQTTEMQTLEALLAECSKLKHSRLAPNTVQGYAYDWAKFLAWCDSYQRTALPATSETLSLYLADVLSKGHKVSTAARWMAAVAHFHRSNGLESPANQEVKEILAAVQRIRGEQPRQMKPLLVEELRAITRKLSEERTPRAVRDRAILVIGFASALRRSNIVALRLEDAEFAHSGVVLRVRREKQDQEGRGRYIGLPRGRHAETCPERTLRAWLKLRGAEPGPLFTREVGGIDGLGPAAIAAAVKRGVARIGLDTSEYGGHSLRAGFVTAAGEAGAGELLIAAQTGHRSMDVLRRYFRRHDLFRSNACAMLGL